VAKAPVRVIGRLAHMDDLAIAEPVLMHSTRIEETVLSYVAKTKSQEHRMAIACRGQIDPSITDTLIEHGDDVVVRYVANNSGARFSEAGLRSLARRAETDGALAEQLLKRRDAPPWLKTMLARHSGSTEKKNARQRQSVAARSQM
jgi:uncharacterized protein (DUF2336 family)